MQTNNRDNFLSTDFGPGEIRSAVTSELHGAGPGELRLAATSELHGAGLKEFNPPSADKCPKSEKEHIRRYRRYLYEAGAISRPDKTQAKVIGDRILKKERKREFELSRNDRFRYRTRYFTDSGVIGSKDFVSKNYMRFKQHFNSKNEKKPKSVKGLSGIYSLKRLSEG